MTARLPTPGSDAGDWGDILNAYLGVSLNPDGSLANNVVGTNQLQNGSVTNTQLDNPTQTTIANVANKYTLPNGGVPKTDLATGVQTSLSSADSALQRRAGTSATTAKLPYLNVLDFGAIGNGSTDDTSAIQSALNALPTGASLYFPAGYNFYCASSLTITNYTTLIGDGYGSEISTSINGVFIQFTNQSRVKFVGLRFLLTGASTTGTLFNLSNCFRISWHRCYMQGQFVGPAGGGSFLGTTAINFNANTGNCNLVDTEINNFGIGIATSAIQNWVFGGQIGSNNVGISGSGGGGLSMSGTVFVSNGANPPTSYHVQTNAATGEWWFDQVWFEGCLTAVQVGTAGTGGPQQFSISKCKIAATNVCLDYQECTSTSLIDVMTSGDSGGSATPTSIQINATNCPSGFAYGLYTNMSTQISASAFPAGWTVALRVGGGAGTFKLPQTLQMERSDGTPINVLQMNPSSPLFTSGVSTGQGAFQYKDSGGHTLLQIDAGGGANYVAPAGGTTGNPAVLNARGSDTNVDLAIVAQGTGGLKLPNGSGGAGGRTYSGSGSPTFSASAGDVYHRTDTPTISGQRLYICTGTTNWTALSV